MRPPLTIVPRLRAMAFEDQQQFGPFGQMPRLVTPRAEDIALVVQVVVPVDRPVGFVVLPYHAAGQAGLAHRDIVGQGFGAVQGDVTG